MNKKIFIGGNMGKNKTINRLEFRISHFANAFQFT